MSVVKEYFYNFKCDICGELCDEEMWHVDEDTVSLVAQEQGWWIDDNGKHYCPNCYEYDDDDNLVLKGARYENK